MHCDAAAAADSTAAGDLGAAKSGTASLSSYGEFSEDDRKLMEETGTKQEFQAEVRSFEIFVGKEALFDLERLSGWPTNGHHHQLSVQQERNLLA